MQHAFSPVAVLLLAVLAVQPYAAEIIATNTAAAVTAAPPPSVFDQWQAEEATNPTPRDTILLVGSSTFTRWQSVQQMMAPYAVRNRGFGGSTMAQVLLYTNHFLQYQSRLVVVYEGDNDFCNLTFTPHAFLAECRRFTELMLAAVPGRDVLFLSVKPSPSRWCFFERQSAANELLRAYALRTPRVHFIDIVPALLG
ncbi:MAG: GDSL-type esterase/lipase family protein, partial [bacterium]|nr:GDSL-type esterase/lipase family protein [bacterium]